MQPKQLVDLHTHTYFSDGLILPEDLVTLAQEEGISLISITDHNTIEAYRHFDWQNAPVKIITGCEFSTQYYGERLHILGYNIDIENPELNAYLALTRNVQMQKLKFYLAYFSNRQITFPQEILDKIHNDGFSASDTAIMEMLTECNVDYNQEEFYLIRKEAAKMFPYQEVPPKFIIDLIHSAGGKAVLAHPGKYRILDTNSLFFQLMQDGLDGVECFHPTHTDKMSRRYRAMAHDYGLFITAGSDAHTYFSDNENSRPFGGESQKTTLDAPKALQLFER